MTQNQCLSGGSPRRCVWPIIGGVALVAVAAAVIANLPDLKRLIKIYSM